MRARRARPGTPPGIPPQDILAYGARVLERGRLEPVRFGDDAACAAASPEQVRAGALDVEQAEALFAHHRSVTRGAARDAETIDVAISLVSVDESEGDRARRAGLLLLAATLHPDGRLEPVVEAGTSPWIPAERLSAPGLEDREVMVGPLERFWSAARTPRSAASSADGDLADQLEIAHRLFRHVAGCSIGEFAAEHRQEDPAPPGTRVEFTRCYVREHDRISALGGLLDLYDVLAREPVLPDPCRTLLEGRGTSRPPRQEAPTGPGGALLRGALAACGSMSTAHPLAPSQRRAVHAVLAGGEGGITAVSGPPGTGKTTMLQAIVADAITRHALDQADAPVIVGTSTNNQAVTNIISSFAAVTPQDPGPLDQRWLPSANTDADEPLSSIAVYCPAQARLAEARTRFLVEQRQKDQTYTAYSDPEYLAGARDHLARCAHRYFGALSEPSQVRQWVHAALEEVDGLREALLRTMAAEGPSARYLRMCREVEDCAHLRYQPRAEELRACTSLAQLDELLDVTLRCAEFWLAVHYYELTWLLTEDFVPADERWKSTSAVMSTYWRQAAALTPCFVMTLYQVPRYFSLYSKEGEPPRADLGRIDLLIVDEAGQVDTPLGLPVLALARSAVVVGDEQQLAPVWSLDEETDRDLASAGGIPADRWTTDLRARGLTCSVPSSLMRAAATVSGGGGAEGAGEGLLLREHFRCHPEIIGYCNELLYEGLLEPRRPAAASRLEGREPAFQWIDLPDSEDEPRGSSRVNRAEARAVARWIIERYPRYRSLYEDDGSGTGQGVAAHELIGVVTPFSAQARLITQEIASAAASADPEAGIPPDLASLLTVGTAHRLQGAERPIILFSAVYGQNSTRASFIARTPQLMNVAVSRAKDLLVVFAAPRRWEDGAVFATMAPFAHPVHWPEDQPAGGVEPEAGEEAELGSGEGAELDACDGSAAATRDGAELDARDGSAAAAGAAPTPAADGLPTIGKLLARWRAEGLLREDDAALASDALNLRLHDAGVLEGEAGAWAPTPLARRLGVTSTQRTDQRGQSFTAIVYGPWAQEILLRLYQDGDL